MDFKNDKIYEFIDKLASDSPVPGGGGAAALIAALSAALGSMVFNLTVGKKAYESMDEEKKATVRDSLLQCQNKIKDFQEYIRKDGEAFTSLMEAYKLPKDSEEAALRRESNIQQGLHNSMMVPFTLGNEISEMYTPIEVASIYGNKNVISDAGVAALLAHAAIESCVLNVRVNLKFINGDNHDIEKWCNTLLEQSKENKDRIMEIVYSRI